MRRLILLALLAAGCARQVAPEADPAATTSAVTSTSSTVASSADVRAWPLTRAERTDWIETSHYDDVVAFLDSLSGSPLLRGTTFGTTVEGRALPLVVVGASSASAQAVRATGRTRVLVFANIHAGEVEGKEVVQMLLRELAQGRHTAWLDSLVLLVAPIYNADGNERFDPGNRSEQNGPYAGVGTRENAQRLDLNRDHMKLDSPEARALIGLIDDYDPHVVVDLHTTNGSYHAYHLTYAAPLHPATDSSITTTLTERWLPAVTRDMAEDGFLAWYYGNLPIRDWGMTGERGWYTFDYRPRFNTHYVGLRNRFGILSESYSYASFEERALATRSFVIAVLDWARAHASEIRATTAAADARDLRGRRLPLRAEIASLGDTIILLGAVEERTNPISGLPYHARLDSVTPERMAWYGGFDATEWETVPGAYLVPADLEAVLDRLRAHGVEMTRITDSGPTHVAPAVVEAFAIDSSRTAQRAFQGHHERELFGGWCQTRHHVQGMWRVDMSQPLAGLAFQLLEPRAADGFANWNVLDAQLEGASFYPILRTRAPSGQAVADC